MTPLRLRPLAEADLIGRTRHYQNHATEDIATRFFNAAIATLDAIGRMPLVGSPRAGELCDVPGLRVQRIAGFPCGWYYFAIPEHVDVVRLLADAQDLPSILSAVTPEDP